MANSDIPNTNTQATANSINQKMVPTGNIPFWQQQASSMSNFPIGGRFQQSPIGPFGPMAPSMRPMNNFTPRPQMGGLLNGMIGQMGMMGQMNGMRGFGPQMKSSQPLINNGISGLLSNMGMQSQPSQPMTSGSNDSQMTRNPQSY